MPSKLRNTLPFLLAFILALVLIPGVARADDALDSVEGVEATEPLELPDEAESTDPAAAVEETATTETDVVLEETVPAETDVMLDEPAPAEVTEVEVAPPILGTRAVTYVAEVDNVKYATIEDAVSHTRNGSTIKLLADCTASSTLNITNSLTIDTNGFTLSNGFEASGSRKPLIKVTGALNVIGTGTISSTSQNVSAIEVHDAGCLHVGDGVTISGTNEAIGMFSTGYVIIAGGNVNAGGSAIYAVLHNNTGCQIKVYRGTLTNTSAYSPVVDIYGPNSTFEMRGGTITGGIGVQTSSSGVTADIYDGTINATLYGVYCMYGDSPFTIRGGSITGGRACIRTPDDYPWSYDLSVTGGTFSGPIDVTNCNHFISGGTFDTTVPSKYLATGCTQNAGGEVIVDLDTYPVFLIHNGNKTPMTSLAGAVAAAQSGDSVLLRRDIEQNDPITISEKRVALDLAGFALTGSGTDRYLFCATGSGTLTVTDSSANRTGSISFSSSTSGGSGYVAALRADGGTIAVQGGTIAGSPYGIVTQGTDSAVAVSNAAVTGTQDGIHVGLEPGDTATVSVGEGALVQGQGSSGCGIGIGTGTVELTMIGGKVTGFQGINQAQGTLAFTMSGGTVEGTFSTTGAQLAAIALKGTSTVDISGGTVTGTSAVLLTPSFSSDTCTPSISGGDFYGTVSSSASGFVTGGTFDALDDAYVAEGYFKEPIDGGRVTVRKDVLTVELSATSATYDASDHTPTVTLRRASASQPIEPSSVTWTLNGTTVTSLVNAGTYTATATIGDEAATAEFVIAPREIDATLPAQGDGCWTVQCTAASTATSIPAAPRPAYNGSPLVAGTDYTATESGNESPYYGPSMAVETTYTGQGNFCGTATRTTTYLAYQPSPDEISLPEIPTQILTGNSVRPDVKIYRRITLPTGQSVFTSCNYKVEYENNTSSGTGTAIATLGFPLYGVYRIGFEILDVRGLGAAIGTADEVLDTYKPVTTDPLDIPQGTRYLPEDAYAALQDARDAANEAYNAPQSQEQIDEATEALETAVSTAQGKIVTHMVDRSAYNKVAQDFMSLIIETKVSDDGKTYRVDNETTAPLEDGDEYFMYEEALRIWEAFLQTNQAYNTATTQRQVDAATAAARTALSALIAAKKTYVASIPMHRLYNPYTGEHLYTASTSERDHLASIGWNYEGIGWYAPVSGVPVYRLYNPNAPGGDHHYTMDKSEYEHLQAVGWSGEGICWYSDPNKSVPVYREYNPNEFAHNHNYTASRAEHDHLVSIGWNDEGIGWYGV